MVGRNLADFKVFPQFFFFIYCHTMCRISRVFPVMKKANNLIKSFLSSFFFYIEF